MPLHSYLVLFAFTVLFWVFILQFIRTKNSLSVLLGNPTIEKLYFVSGKITLFTTWFLFIIKAINPRLGYLDVPPGLSWLAVGLLYIGALILAISLINLGKSLMVGLPSGETTLQTHGLYRYSRNPIYLGVHTIAIASCIYFPDLINIAFTIYGIYIHHLIIKEEENFLAKRFGPDWVTYCSKGRRYL
jgi:protein-S-isoprenylcysteine O-methyltransferase Ste14